MAAINAVDPGVLATVNQTTQASARSTADEIGTNFMTLLVTQLQNQDPLKPMENAEVTSQLAQVNTVNGIENLNKTLTGIQGQIGAGQQLQATMLIDRGVMVEGDQVLVGAEGATTPFGVELPSPAADVRVALVSEAGEVVRSFAMGTLPAGSKTLVWDGLMENGAQAPEGAYRVSVEARGTSGAAVPTRSLNYALVNGVSVNADGEAILDLGGVAEPVPLSAVRQIF